MVAVGWVSFGTAVPSGRAAWRLPDTYHMAGIRRGPPPQVLRSPGQPPSEPADPGNGRSSCGNGQARSQMPRVNLARHPPYDLDWHDTATSRAVATPVPLWPAGPSGRAARGPGNSAVSSLKDDGWRP